MIEFEENFKYKLIYIFEIEDAAHKGLLKIGDATLKINQPAESLTPNCKVLNKSARKRISEYTRTAGIKFNLLHTELAVTNNSKTFRDYDVHQVLMRSGVKKVSPRGSNAREWFKVDLQTAVRAILAVKRGEKTVLFGKSPRTEIFVPIIFRPEQENFIKETVRIFKAENRMLWNAKMRFGKTLCALEVVRRMDFSKTLIITHRPVVNQGWFEDFDKVFNKNEKFAYGSKNSGETAEKLLRGTKNFVYFASLQDLRGSEFIGGNFDKNPEIFSANWDCLIVDEAHEGTKTILGDSVIKNLVGAKTKLLALSGTPFNILEDYEGKVLTWNYIDEQRAKSDWSKIHGLDSNPYADLPAMKIFTYNLGALLDNPAFLDEDKSFSFKEFFRTDANENFVHEKAVKQFLELLTRAGTNYPFSNERFRKIFNHSLWIIPGVKAGRALSKILQNHFVFRQFKIVNVAGDGDADEESKNALEMVQQAIAENDCTITLSCGKLTAGVTVPEWTAVFMLAGGSSTSAANYMQTIFRTQSPCNKNGLVKDACYVFDFAPDRALKVITESIAATGGNRQQLAEFLNFCPVISLEGSVMVEFDTPRLFQQLKRAQSERVVRRGFDDPNLYNARLLNLSDAEIEKFNKLKGIIGTSKAQGKSIEISGNGVTGEGTGGGKDKKTVDPELEKRKKQRRNAISILRGISIRMPLLIYGADVPFEKDFTIQMLLDDNIIDAESWTEFMPKGVTKEKFRDFIKYYDEDIFIGAGRKIRDLAKSADNFPPAERVKKIAELFSCFKNPDKETVLTPWRVVNLHLSSALGGFDFFDEKYEDTLAAPRFVNRGKVTAQTLANPFAQILEINSKTGLYPLFAAYSLYRARLNDSESGYSFEYLQDIWNVTLRENIFVICKTPMAKTITRRTLAGFSNAQVNAAFFDNLIPTLKNSPADFISAISNNSFWNKGVGTMKFDAVVGNPPYQEVAENTSDTPVYQLFLEKTLDLKTKVSLIHPARFLFNAGKTPDKFINQMLHDKHFKVIYYTPQSWELFPNSDIKGGIAITYYDPDEDFGEIGMFFPAEELKSIHKKVVLDNPNFKPFSEIVYAPESYGFTEKLHRDFPDAVKSLSKGHAYDVTTNIFDTLPKVFFKDKPNDGYEYVQLWGREKNKRVCKWIRRDYLTAPANFPNYKIIIPKSNGTGMIGEKLSTPLVGLPLVGCTQTFISVGAFDSAVLAGNCLKYIKTKFARALLGILKVTQHNPAKTWACVPLEDFSPASEIDWSRSIHRIDLQLYRKYGLTAEEIKFIEEKVRSMD